MVYFHSRNQLFKMIAITNLLTVVLNNKITAVIFLQKVCRDVVTSKHIVCEIIHKVLIDTFCVHLSLIRSNEIFE